MGRMAEYRDSFSETSWTRFVRALSASFRLGRFFQVEVRVFWVTLLVMPLILLRTVEGLTFIQGLAWIVAVTVLLYVVIWSHEMSHILAGRRYGISTPLITLSPLGGLAHMSAPAPSPGKEAIIAAAGPMAHIVWLAVLYPLSLLLPEPTTDGWYWLTYELVDAFVLLNLWLMIFNLLPFFPMDGGRVLRALMAKRMAPYKATLIAARIGMAGAVVFMIVGVVLWIRDSDNLWGIVLFVIGLANLGACRREVRAMRDLSSPYGDGESLAPWQSDPEAWKQGGETDWRGEESSQPGFFARRKAQKEEARRRRAAQDDAALDADVDRVLDRLAQVGMEGLTAQERKILEQASKRRRTD